MKGIILAGGSGTRLDPITNYVSKQLLPVYDKPMIFYPISTLMLGGIRDILVISTPRDLPRFKALLGDGSQWGLSLTYEVQEKPNGLAEAFIIGKDFIGNESVALILGDNLFYGNKLSEYIKSAVKQNDGATIFAYQVKDPERYGIVEFAKNGNVVSIEEKPKLPKSSFAIPGLYFYDNQVIEFAESLKPSQRGEIEITDIHNHYLKKGQLKVTKMSRGMAWLDTGTFDSLLDASRFIQTVQERQGIKIACLEEIAYRMQYIDSNRLKKLSKHQTNQVHAQYLLDLLNQEFQK